MDMANHLSNFSAFIHSKNFKPNKQLDFHVFIFSPLSIPVADGASLFPFIICMFSSNKIMPCNTNRKRPSNNMSRSNVDKQQQQSIPLF